MDWRLHGEAEKFFNERYGRCDFIGSPGAIKGLTDDGERKRLLAYIALSQKLHHANVVALTVHRDCDAYGGSAAFPNPEAEDEHHKGELERAKTLVAENFPGVTVETYFLDLEWSDTKWQCVPKAV
jgi:hypothetical protein